MFRRSSKRLRRCLLDIVLMLLAASALAKAEPLVSPAANPDLSTHLCLGRAFRHRLQSVNIRYRH